MRVSDGVLDLVVIFTTLALCVLCTGTWLNWRRDFKWLAQNSQNRLHSGKRSDESFECIMIYSAHLESPIGDNSRRHLRPHHWTR